LSDPDQNGGSQSRIKMDNLYRDNILDHYRSPKNFGRIKNPDVASEEVNSLCGDKIGMQIKLKKQSCRDGTLVTSIQDIGFYGEACAISTASASMLTEKVRGMEVGSVKKMTVKDILMLLGIELTPTRLKCALLPLEVLQKAITQSSLIQGQSCCLLEMSKVPLVKKR